MWEPRTSTFSILFIVHTLLTSFLETTIIIDLMLTYCIFPHHSLLKWVGKQGVRRSKGRLGGRSEGKPSAWRLWCFYVQNAVLVNNADGLSLFQNICYFIVEKHLDGQLYHFGFLSSIHPSWNCEHYYNSESAGHYEWLGKCCNCGKQYPKGQDSFCLHLPRTMISNHINDLSQSKDPKRK